MVPKSLSEGGQKRSYNPIDILQGPAVSRSVTFVDGNLSRAEVTRNDGNVPGPDHVRGIEQTLQAFTHFDRTLLMIVTRRTLSNS